MKLIFMGPQGSGKGTQARKVAERFGLCHISTGDLLRHCEGELRVEVNRIMKSGNLVSDKLVVRILKEKLTSKDCKKGFILDGFPRDVVQAEMLERITDIDKVFDIVISDNEAIKRVCGRRNCKKCGAIFNINSNPSKVEGVCDRCGGELFIRKDDNEDALKKRLKVYHKDTEKVLKMYDFFRIDGEQDVNKVFEDILEVLE